MPAFGLVDLAFITANTALFTIWAFDTAKVISRCVSKNFNLDGEYYL